MKGRVTRRNINFRQTHSERSATKSYRGFGTYIKQKFKKLVDNRGI